MSDPHRLEYTLEHAGEASAHCVCGWHSQVFKSMMTAKLEHRQHLVDATDDE